MRKVLLLTYQHPPTVGGAGIVAQDTAKLLNIDNEVTVVTLDTGKRIDSPYSLIYAKTQWPIRFIGFWRALKQLKLESYDRVILNDTGACLVAALFFSKALQNKSWVYLHGSEPENIYLKPELMFRLLNFEKKYNQLLDHCQSIVAVSEYMKHKFIELTGLKALESKIDVVTNGIDGTIFRPTTSKIRETHSIPEQAKVMLSVSRLVSKKGYLRKLRLFKKLKEKHDLFWIIVGNGPFAEELQRQIEESDLQEVVIIVQNLKRLDLVEYYSGADLFWLLSEYEESFGLVYLEANFCGCPVIGNDKGGIPYVIEQNQNGCVVPPQDDEAALEIIENSLQDSAFSKEQIIASTVKYSMTHLQHNLETKLTNH